MRNILNKIIVLIVLIPLGYFTMELFDVILKSGTTDLIHPSYNFKLIYLLIYGIILSVTLALLPTLSRAGILYLVLFSLLGFGLHCLAAIYLSHHSILPEIRNTVDSSFSLYFSYPVYILAILFIIEILRKLNFKWIFTRIPTMKSSLDLRLSRLLAYLIDWLAAVLIYFLLSSTRVIPLSPLLVLFIIFAYRVIFETVIYQTPGKRIMGNLMVVCNNLSKPEFDQIVKRNLSRLIFVYMIPILWNKNGIHDIIAKTKVVKPTAAK
jgi:uncharacterized RDD family membrane protein YckC